MRYRLSWPEGTSKYSCTECKAATGWKDGDAVVPRVNPRRAHLGEPAAGGVQLNSRRSMARSRYTALLAIPIGRRNQSMRALTSKMEKRRDTTSYSVRTNFFERRAPTAGRTPVNAPEAPVRRPAKPVAIPACPVYKPATPVTRPDTPVGQPESPVDEPEARAHYPARRVGRPDTRVCKPATRVARPEARVMFPEDPVVDRL